MDDLISKLSEIRSDYNCFNAGEEPYYRALSEAIKILSQRADGDTISRQKTIHAISDWIYDTTDERLPETVIRSLSAVQPEPKWIPCGERLPEDGRCLVTRFDFVTNTCFLDILWYEKGVWWNRLYTGDFAVIAWMPLPAPYRRGDE